jgi:DNA polymerase I-like protein with 3'-5' exonuclease and polymerase domains
LKRFYLGPAFQDEAAEEQAYRDLWSSPPPFVALDIETRSLKENIVLGIGLSTPDLHTWYWPIWEPVNIPWHLIMPSETRKIWHNAPYDLSRELMGKFSADLENIDDTIIVTRMLPDVDNSLKFASALLEINADNMGDVLKAWDAKIVDELPLEVVAEKCLKDAAATMLVWKKYRPQVSDEYYEVERRFMVKLLKMSYKGVKIDQQRAELIDRELEARLAVVQGKTDALGFNPWSPQQVSVALMDMGYHVPFKYVRGVAHNPDTSEAALEALIPNLSSEIDATVLKMLEAEFGRDMKDHPVNLVLEARRVRRAHARMHKWARADRAYTHLYMDGITGRTMSRDDNLQNIDSGHDIKRSIRPKAGSIRSIFVPDGHVGTTWDLSQIELRVFAHLSGDKKIQETLNDPTRDFHTETMVAVGLDSRVYAKNLNFGKILYNGSSAVIAETIHKTIAEVDAIWLKWAETYPDAAGWLEDRKQEGLRTYKTETLYGREISLLSGFQEPTEKHIENCACNYPIQGSAAEIFKRIMIEVPIPDEDILLQVHDEEWANGAHKIPAELEHIAPFWTPIETSYVSRFEKV